MEVSITSHIPDDFLTAQRVRDVYGYCYKSEHTRSKNVERVSGWLLRHTLSVNMLMKYREDIVKFLLCIPSGFRVDVGSGGSVLMATQRDDGTLWTDDLADVERLIALGLGLKLVEFCLPRSEWDKLPRGAPYIRVEITRFGVSIN